MISGDGRALRRGYLDLILDEYNGDDETLRKASEKHKAVLTINLLENQRGRMVATDFRSFATNIDADLPDDTRRTVIKKLADKVIDLGVSAFTDDLDSYDEKELPELQEFLSYIDQQTI